MTHRFEQPPRILIWMNFPSHHQSPFFSALRAAGVDLRVCYYENVQSERLAMGWGKLDDLPPGEQFVPGDLGSLERVGDWRQRIHVHPGYGTAFARALAVELSRSKVAWVHWSEPAYPGLRWWVSFPVKRWYARLVNRHAWGALGNGVRALEDFERWGMRKERFALLPYSPAACDPLASPDPQCERFRSGRQAFLFLGALCRRKAVDVLLAAFARVAREQPEWVLLVVGNDRSGGVYHRLAERLGLKDRVLFRGPVPASQVADVFKSARVLVLPSRFDGWGAVVNEAASMGMALIASDQVGAAYHLLEPGQNGFRVRAGSTESLARAMRAYIREPDLADAHGANSRVLFQGFTPERSTERLLAALHTWQAMGPP